MIPSIKKFPGPAESPGRPPLGSLDVTQGCFMSIPLFWAGCHLVPSVYPAEAPGGRVLGPGQGWAALCPRRQKPRGHLGAKAVFEGVWVPWGTWRAILEAETCAGGGWGSERQEWCGFFSSRFQTAFLFFHTETIKALKQGFGPELKAAFHHSRTIYCRLLGRALCGSCLCLMPPRLSR